MSFHDPRVPRRPFTEAEVLARLGELERRWPAHLMLFSAQGSLYVLTKEGYGQQGQAGQNESIPGSARLASFIIPTDGGDPTFDERL